MTLLWSEADRLAELDAYGILDTDPEPAFDDIVELLSDALDTPIAVVNLVAASRQWFKAEQGLGVRETPTNVSICARILLNPGLTVVPDLTQDPRFESNPFVTGLPHLRFYAGHTLVTPRGLPLGTLCVLDTRPRPEGLTPRQSRIIATLARQVMAQMDLRRAVAEGERTQAALRDSESRLASMFDQANVGLYELDLETRFLRVNQEHARIIGRPERDVLGATPLGLTHPDDIARSSAAMQQVIATGRTAQLQKRFQRPDGTTVWAGIALSPLRDADGTTRSILGVSLDLTQRIATDERLVLSEASLRLATEAAGVGTWDQDLVNRVVTWSGQTKAMFGISPDTPYDMDDLYNGIHPDDRTRVRSAFASAIDPARRSTFDVECRTLGKEDGQLRWIAARGRALFDAQGQAVRALGTALDITARKEAQARLDRSEALLAESEAKFRAITDSIDQMVWSTRPDGFHDFYNQRWYDYTGVPQGSTDGEAWNGMFHEDDQARAWATWGRCLASGEPYRIEYRLRHRSGQYRWVLGRAQPVRDEHGRIVRWYGTCTDIQDIVEARDVLAQSREKLERLVAQRTDDRDRLWRLSTDVMLVADFEGTALAVNPAWTTLLGWPEPDLVGRNFYDMIHPDDAQRTRDAFAGLSAGQVVSACENRCRHRDGTYRWITWAAVPGDGLINAVGRDTTAAKQAAADLAATQDQLRQAQKMEAVGQLTGGIAHDFNNMLAVVIGSLDLLGRRLDPAATRERRYVDAAMEGARRAAQLTQRLLAFSRQQPLQPETIDANKLVAGMSELLRHSLGAAIRLETVLAGGLWRSHTDPNQLENVILNLAVNARDAMPEGGRLTIETQNAHIDDHYVASNHGAIPGQYVMIAVTDTGSGMDAATMAKAFDPFFTTKEVGKGTGLGLSQAYGFVKQSGGYLKLYSEPGHGTTAKLYLPRLFATDAETSDSPAPAPPPQGGRRETILVVEDEATVRQLSVEALTELGYRVLEADGAPTALRMLAANPEIQLLFTDVVMPETNGRKLADEVLRIRPGLPVLFTTGYTRNAVVHNNVLDKGVNLLGKPFTIEELAAKVRTLLDTTRD